ncbi:septum formation initiator family protein [Nocardioides sp. dk4132]|uniref:FtsB family cell division protein n=1 Tax=unclassified Nocardioides TaxID=2615069 RepID=UPI001295574C|nr:MULTISPECIES: septum formation initiator family protein [unclassified Nocardioides]MQW75867.1 septum formation initiator family protein [Nocardioides sp. dk4132]QGA08732.1 septum formation initiator family protein [Nocardioides sp. dk884]
MADDRRRTRRGTSSPRARTGPGRPASGSGRARTSTPPATGGSSGPRSRLTGRTAVLVLVLAVLAVSYASSLRAYLDQRSHLQDLQAKIAERQAAIDDLERERRRWEDPAYVEREARERLGYVKPGVIPYIVLDENGEPVEPQSTLGDPDRSAPQTPEAWWTGAWGSVEAAGHPPRNGAPPSAEIDGSPDGEQPQKENPQQ